MAVKIIENSQGDSSSHEIRMTGNNRIIKTTSTAFKMSIKTFKQNIQTIQMRI